MRAEAYKRPSEMEAESRKQKWEVERAAQSERTKRAQEQLEKSREGLALLLEQLERNQVRPGKPTAMGLPA